MLRYMIEAACTENKYKVCPLCAVLYLVGYQSHEIQVHDITLGRERLTLFFICCGLGWLQCWYMNGIGGLAVRKLKHAYCVPRGT